MSSSEDLATPCLQPCTLALPDSSGHNTASCHLLPTRGQPLPPPGHGLIISRKCPQPHGPCCYMRTLPVGASQPSCPVNGSQRLRDRPLSLGSCAPSGHQSAGGRKWTELT